MRVFLDVDHDGRFSPGDKPLPKVTFLLNGMGDDRMTNTQGIALLSGLPVDQPTDLSVTQGSLEEPLWAPLKPGVRFTSRPGNMLQIDFAITALGEVSGTVYRLQGGQRRELGGVPVELVDTAGKVNAEGALRWDGPPGRWTVLRWGRVNSGKRNGPARAGATGWECDKLSTAGADTHFAGYIGRLAGKNGPVGGGRLNGVLMDSWECETQTWTPGMDKQFAR